MIGIRSVPRRLLSALLALFLLSGCEDKAALQIESAKRVARSDPAKAAGMLDTPELKASPRATRLRRQWQVEVKDRAADAEARAAVARARELYREGRDDALLELERTMGGKAARIRSLFQREAGLVLAAAKARRDVRMLLDRHQLLRAIARLDKLERGHAFRGASLPAGLAELRVQTKVELASGRETWRARFQAASEAGDVAGVRAAWTRLIKLYDAHHAVPVKAAARLKELEAEARSGSDRRQRPERATAPLRPEVE